MKTALIIAFIVSAIYLYAAYSLRAAYGRLL